MLFIDIISILRLYTMDKLSKLRYKNIYIMAYSSWVVAIALSVSPVLLDYAMTGKSVIQLGICTTLVPTIHSGHSFIGISLVINILTLLSSLLVILCYVRIYRKAVNSRKILNTMTAAVGNKQVKPLHFILVSGSNIICWIPVAVITLISTSGFDLSTHISTGFTVISIPINSILNPCFYSLINIVRIYRHVKR
jgi:hypothetical protein